MYCFRIKFYLALHAVKSKRCIKLNENQKSVLEAVFRVHFFPNKTAIKELALKTGLKEKQVSGWFKRTRCNARSGKCHQNLFLSEFVFHRRVHYDYVHMYNTY